MLKAKLEYWTDLMLWTHKGLTPSFGLLVCLRLKC